MKRRIAARKAAAEVKELLGADLTDPEFLDAFIATIYPKKERDKDAAEEQEFPAIAQLGATRVEFGKAHKGKTFDEIPRDWLEWLSEEGDNFQRDLRLYLRHPHLDYHRLKQGWDPKE